MNKAGEKPFTIPDEYSGDVLPGQIPQYRRQCVGSSGLAVFAVWSRVPTGGGGAVSIPTHDVLAAVFLDGTVVQKIEDASGGFRYEAIALGDVEARSLIDRIAATPLMRADKAPNVVAVDGDVYEVQLALGPTERHFQITPSVIFVRSVDYYAEHPDFSLSIRGLRELFDMVAVSTQGHPPAPMPDMQFVRTRLME